MSQKFVAQCRQRQRDVMSGCSKGSHHCAASGVVYVEHAMEAVKTIVGKEGYLKDLVGNSGRCMFLDLGFQK